MRVEIGSARAILDDVFRVEEASVRFERFDGTMSKVVRRLSFVRGDSVAAILVNRRRGVVILIKQFRYPTCGSSSGWTIEAIAGTLQPDETPEAAMRREIEEETGYRIGDLIRIATFFVSPGGTSERVFLFQAEVGDSDKVAAGGGLAVEEEDIQVLALPFGALPAMLADGEIADAKTIIGLQWLLAGGFQQSGGHP
jgi:ADP-ribose pyrophosphatase